MGPFACEKRGSITLPINHQSPGQHLLGIKQKVDCVDEKFSSPGKVYIGTIAEPLLNEKLTYHGNQKRSLSTQ